MLKRSLMAIVCSVTAVLGVCVVVSQPVASAASCPSVEVVFARGTAEPAPPLGLTGIAFTEALRGALRGKSLVNYGVNYPASADFGNRLAFGQTVINGIKDTQKRITFLARTCPRTRIVVGGYSQGAVVAGYAVGPTVALPAPYARYANTVPAPLPADVAGHVAAVVLFAPPSARFLRDAGAPPLTIGSQYRAKTIRYCIPGDTVCDGARLQTPNGLHVLYSVNGDAFDAARRVAARVR